MTDVEHLDVSNYERALETLREALAKGRLSDLERDGAIQRYECTFELAWKMMRKALMAMGRADVSASPNPILRDACEEELIEDVKLWFGFLEARNLGTHIYSEKEAESVHRAAKAFLPHAERLLKRLKGLKDSGDR